MGEITRGFFPSPPAHPMRNTALEDTEERPEPRPPAPRGALGLLFPGLTPHHRQPPHLPLALLHLPGTCPIRPIGRELSTRCARMPPRGVPLPTPNGALPGDPEHSGHLPHSLFSPLPPGKAALRLTCQPTQRGSLPRLGSLLTFSTVEAPFKGRMIVTGLLQKPKAPLWNLYCWEKN